MTAQPLLDVSDLTVEFTTRRGIVKAVQHVNISVGKGETVGIVGESGSGKSPCAKIVLGLLSPDQGEVRLLGRPWSTVSEAGRRPLRRKLQYIPQDALSSFDPRYRVQDIIAENLAGLPERKQQRERIVSLLELVGLSAEYLERRPRSLSGGQRQRVFVAQGLVQHADVLLLDEPLAGLDLASQQQIRAVIAEERDLGRTVVTSTHDLSEAARADHLVLLAGRLVAAGTPDEVLTADHLAAAYRGAVLLLADGALMVDDGAHHHPEAGPHDEADHGRHEHRADEQRRRPAG